MGDLTKNISRHELECNCGECGLSYVCMDTVNAVQECCDHFANKLGLNKVVLVITSASRCYEYNRLPVSEGGPGSNDNSQHPKCKAIDFKILSIDPHDVYDYLNAKYSDRYGIGDYDRFTHLDTRDYKARWEG